MGREKTRARSFDFVQITDSAAICQLLYQFDCVFPHLKEKVSDYQEYAEKLKKYAVVCTAQENGVVCGLLVVYVNDLCTKAGYISLVGLLPQWQGRNLGQLLMDYCADAAQARGMETLRLEVDLDNDRAIRFYERLGFVPWGEKKESSMHMEKKLI